MGESSNGLEGIESFWKTVWNSKVPNKVKIFVWRACRDLLPTSSKLCQRKVIPSGVCQLCWKREETILLCLWDCKEAKKVWSLDPNFLSILKTPFSDLASLICDGVKKLKGYQMDWFFIVAWKIWSSRNAVIMEKKIWEAGVTFQRADSFYQEWFLSSESDQGTLSARIPGCWVPPPVDFVKVNFDGAFSKESNFSGVGVVIRNERGELMACLEKQIARGVDVSHVESSAALSAVELAIDCGFEKVIIEGDALAVTKAIESKDMDLSSKGHQIEEIKRLCRFFRSFSICHIKREGHEVANCLAHKAFVSRDRKSVV